MREAHRSQVQGDGVFGGGAAGRLCLGQDFANRGDLVGAEREMRRAVEWDQYSPGIREAQSTGRFGASGWTDPAGNILGAPMLAA